MKLINKDREQLQDFLNEYLCKDIKYTGLNPYICITFLYVGIEKENFDDKTNILKVKNDKLILTAEGYHKDNHIIRDFHHSVDKVLQLYDKVISTNYINGDIILYI